MQSWWDDDELQALQAAFDAISQKQDSAEVEQENATSSSASHDADDENSHDSKSQPGEKSAAVFDEQSKHDGTSLGDEKNGEEDDGSSLGAVVPASVPGQAGEGEKKKGSKKRARGQRPADLRYELGMMCSPTDL